MRITAAVECMRWHHQRATVESFWADGEVVPGKKWTKRFIYPGMNLSCASDDHKFHLLNLLTDDDLRICRYDRVCMPTGKRFSRHTGLQLRRGHVHRD
jgi:hypothetical protein